MGPIRTMRNIILFLLLLLFPPGASFAEELPPGKIKGSVLNKTLNGTRVKDLEIILYQYKENKGAEVARTKTDPNGSFLFQGLNRDKQISYYASAKYKEVDYFSEMTHFLKKKELSFDLSVYETTDQDKDIHIKMHHILLETDNNTKDTFVVREIMIVENQGNKTYTGSKEVQPGKKETLRISLPKNAKNIQSMLPLAVNPWDGFSTVTAFSPGTKRIIFSYTIKPGSADYKFEKNLYFKTDSFNFIFPKNGIQVKSDQLIYKGPTPNSDQRFSYLAGKDMTGKSKVVIRLSLPSTDNLFKWVIAGPVMVLVGTGFVLFLIKGRKHRAQKGDDPAQKPSQITMAEQRQKILQSMAELDKQHDAGQIDSDKYESQRRILMEKAVEITKILKDS
jgi:5-hydroxyisourate hydrolase-like protein (transthyretin family)